MPKARSFKALHMKAKRETERQLLCFQQQLVEQPKNKYLSQGIGELMNTENDIIDLSHTETPGQASNQVANCVFQCNDLGNDGSNSLNSFEGSNTELLNSGVECQEKNLTNRNASIIITTDINFQLRHWSISNNTSHSSLTSLLKILKPHFSTLPLDSRTLLNTPRVINKKVVNPGEYYHLGLEKGVLFLLRNTKNKTNTSCCEILVNVDGLPLSKSSGSQLYPILISLFPSTNLVSLIGLYHGYDKPNDSNIYLKDFVNEAIHLTTNGIDFNNKHFDFKIKGFVCDAPAKSFIKCIKGHSGYFSCSKCHQEGEYRTNRVCFPDIQFIERTDIDFAGKFQEEHHTGRSVLEDIPGLGLVSGFPLDYMHLVCLGVVKKLIVTLWCHGKPPYKLSAFQINKISNNLLKQKKNIPSEFCRKPRSLSEAKRWKATEFRQFLFYTGPVVLKNVISKKYYFNFLVLHIALSILANPESSKNFIDYAQSLLIYFVQSFTILYGKEFVSHNIHNLLHLSNDVKLYGPLDTFSAFPFENFMQVLLKFNRKPENPLSQIVKRFLEAENLDKNLLKLDSDFIHKFNEHTSGPLPQNCFSPQYSKVNLNKAKFILKTKVPDNCCGLKNGDIIIIENIASDKHKCLVLVGRKFNNISNFFTEPCPSSQLGIYTVADLGDLQFWAFDEVSVKYVKLEYLDSFVVLPLLHSEL